MSVEVQEMYETFELVSHDLQSAYVIKVCVDFSLLNGLFEVREEAPIHLYRLVTFKFNVLYIPILRNSIPSSSRNLASSLTDKVG